MKLITSSTPQIINERMMEATNTIIALLTSCVLVGQETLWTSSLQDSWISANSLLNTFISLILSTGREARTPDTRFWRPVLYQLS